MKRSAIFISKNAMLIFCMAGIQLQSCKHDPVGIANIRTVCFENEILPMLKNSCGMAGCHDAQFREGRGFNPSDYQSLLKYVSPGNANKSKLYQVIGSVYGNIMPKPPYPPLSIENRTLIEVWIEQGANNTKCDTSTTTGGVNGTPQIDTICFAQDIMPIIQSSCAIKPATGVGCHDGSGGEARALTNYNSLLTYINKGNPLHSKIYTVLSGSGEDKMPPSPYNALNTDQINNFKTWLTQGALNSDCASIKGCDTTGTISFSSTVWPIIQNNCLGCHSGAYPNGNVSLTNYNQVKTYADNLRNSIPVIDGAIRHLPNFKAMPQSGQLSLCSIRKIELWIGQGKQNN